MKKVIITLIMSLVLAGSAAVSALAQDDMASVKQQIADLEKKLSVMESKQAQSTGAATGLRHTPPDQGMLSVRSGRPGNSLRSDSPGRFSSAARQASLNPASDVSQTRCRAGLPLCH